MRRTTAALAAAVALVATGLAAPATSTAAVCPAGKFDRAGTCTTFSEAARQIRLIVRSTMSERDARGVLIRVQVGSRTLVNRGFGESLPGVPATADMRFRPGSMTLPMLTTLLLALQDERKLSLEDKLARWLPQYPNADRVTLRMLASSTSGYPDYIQGNEPFQRIQQADPSRRWTEDDLMRYAFTLPVPCEPVACFHYAHTNFVLLGQVVRRVTGRTLTREMTERFLRPLRMRNTTISTLVTIPAPAFHVYTTDRGVFEDSTFWSPSWGLGEGMVMTSTVGDITRLYRAIGSGRFLLSRSARRQLVAPLSRGLPGAPRTLDFGLGILVGKGWMLQNPQFNGYIGLVAHMRERGISIAIENSIGPNAGPRPISPVIFGRITQYLTPDRALTF